MTQDPRQSVEHPLNDVPTEQEGGAGIMRATRLALGDSQQNRDFVPREELVR
jgi:hypothetical protein